MIYLLHCLWVLLNHWKRQFCLQNSPPAEITCKSCQRDKSRPGRQVLFSQPFPGCRPPQDFSYPSVKISHVRPQTPSSPKSKPMTFFFPPLILIPYTFPHPAPQPPSLLAAHLLRCSPCAPSITGCSSIQASLLVPVACLPPVCVRDFEVHCSSVVCV